MEEKVLKIPSEGGEIHATLVVGVTGGKEEPADAGRKPLVILCHGLMMHSGQNPVLGMSESFVKAGYDALRFDFRGSGLSSGAITDMTPLTEVEDLLNVIRYVQREKVILCGHSLGGLVSLLAVSRLSGTDAFNPVAGLILLAPAVNLEADAKAGRVALETFDPENVPDYVEVWGSRLGRDYFSVAQNLDIFNSISKCRYPACVLMGDRDKLVALNYVDEIQKALPQAEMHIIPHGDHLFSRGLRIRAFDMALDFLSRLA